jgi:hypothetical protein
MLKNIGKLLLVIAIAIGTTSIWSSSASAATPPDSCFDFNSGTGTIVDYYDNEGNNGGNPACTRDVDIPSTIGGNPVLVVGTNSFSDDAITSLTIPSSVTTIEQWAFRYNDITTLTIPNTILSIGEGAFDENQISTLTLGNGLTIIENDAFRRNYISVLTIPDSVITIEEFAFSLNNITELNLGDSVETIGFQAFPGNKIVSVNLPASVTSIGAQAFMGQSSIDGEEVEVIMDSGDPAQIQPYMDEIFFARLYTADPSNPASLTDEVLTEQGIGGDLNNDGDQTDSLGGHLINPAGFLLSHEDDQGNAINADTSLVGSGGISNYFADQNDDNDLSRYYRLNQTPTISPLTISGYNSPAPADITVSQLVTPYTFIYAAVSSGGADSGSSSSGGGSTSNTLADSGAMIMSILGFAAVPMLGGLSLVRSKPHRFRNK